MLSYDNTNALILHNAVCTNRLICYMTEGISCDYKKDNK